MIQITSIGTQGLSRKSPAISASIFHVAWLATFRTALVCSSRYCLLRQEQLQRWQKAERRTEKGETSHVSARSESQRPTLFSLNQRKSPCHHWLAFSLVLWLAVPPEALEVPPSPCSSALSSRRGTGHWLGWKLKSQEHDVLSSLPLMTERRDPLSVCRHVMRLNELHVLCPGLPLTFLLRTSTCTASRVASSVGLGSEQTNVTISNILRESARHMDGRG